MRADSIVGCAESLNSLRIKIFLFSDFCISGRCARP